MNYEFSLVLFTVFGQLAAGLALLAWLAGSCPCERRLWASVLASGLFALIGGITHLHSPAAAPYMILGIGGSWLSLEGLAGAVFGFIALLRLLNILKARHNFLPALTGLIFVLVMTQIYFQNPLMPLWNNGGTILAFLAATLALGGAATLALHQENIRAAYISLGAFIVGALCLGAMPLFWLGGLQNNLNPQQLGVFSQAALCLGLTQQIFLAAGGLLLTASMSRSRLWACLGCILTLAGILAGRMLFYAAGSIKLGF